MVSARLDKMHVHAEELPVLIDGLEVAKVVFHPATAVAIQAARKAAFDISSTKDVQFCPFSDGSHWIRKGRNFGGVAVVYRRQWLPDGWTSDQTGTHPNGDFLKQAWSYKRAIGNNAMEGVGVLESLHAANKTIARDLQVLKDHDCTVTVKSTTDSREILRHIATKKEKNQPTIPRKLINRIKDEIQMLHGHGITVTVELHWCPRNEVPQLEAADDLAFKAMRNGLGYSNADDEIWSETIKSEMALEIEMMVTLPEGSPGGSMQMSRKAQKKERRKARLAEEAMATSADDADAHPQLPLPSAPHPTKPGNKSNTPAANSTGAVTPSLGLATVEAVKRKVEDEEDAKEPMKRAKVSHGKEGINNIAGEIGSEAVQGIQYACTMPARGGMEPETKVFSGTKLDVQRPSARMVVLATMEWRQERRMSLSTML